MYATHFSAVDAWIAEAQVWLEPAQVEWILDPRQVWSRITGQLAAAGVFHPLNSAAYPDCFWCRSDPSDVARVEDRTFICTPTEAEAGPTNRWREAGAMLAELQTLMRGCMRGRTMYVIPYLMGPAASPFSKVGFELTDSPVTVANMLIMTRAGEDALRHLSGTDPQFVKGVHSKGTLDPEQRYICHFPRERLVISFNSDYGGNALQGKKCFALRLASWLGRQEGWLAEHMLITAVTTPEGRRHYLCGAFPSACGKTNLAMLAPPESYRKQGWKVEVIGDDIAWLHIGGDGTLRAINPENGFFGVAPGTSAFSNPSALATVRRHTIFTNTALDLERNEPWWEGFNDAPPARFKDWLGAERISVSKERPAAHPNSRFTAPVEQCPVLAPEWESSQGVPVAALLFGGRRAGTVPLVVEAESWKQGVYLGVTMSSETTAAAAGEVGRVRRDPMAMLPFIGYHACDYFTHWLSFEERLDKAGGRPPRIFQVNWFRRDKRGRYLWPGFGENIRVLEWIIRRIEGTAPARSSAIGRLPVAGSLTLDGLACSQRQTAELLRINRSAWIAELEDQRRYLETFGERLPRELLDINQELLAGLKTSRRRS